MGNGKINKREIFEWFIALLLTVIVIFGLDCFNEITFESNDDTGIMKTLSGYTLGVTTSLHPYVSVIIGSLLSKLYSVFSSVSWYTVYSFTIPILCYTIISKLLLAQLRNIELYKSIFFMFTEVGLLMVYPILNISYTVNAGLCGTVAIILLLAYGDNERQKRYYIIFSVVFLAVCMLIRFSSFKAILPFWIISYIYSVYNRNHLKWYGKKVKILIHSTAVMFLLVGVLIVYSNLEANYKSKNELSSYQEYEVYRGKFSDSPCVTYDEEPEFYASLGWDKEMYTMAKSWYYLDERFNKDTLSAIVEKSKTKNFNQKRLGDSIGILKEKVYKDKLVLAFVLFFTGTGIYLIVTLFNERKIDIRKLFVLSIIMLFWFEFFYLSIKERIVIRAFLCAVLPVGAVCLFYMANYLKEKSTGVTKKVVNTFTILLGVVVSSLAFSYSFDKNARNTKDYVAKTNTIAESVENYCSQYPENFYIYDGTIVDDTRLSIETESVIGSNRMFWGGSTAFNLQYYKKLQLNGFDNFTTENLFEDNVYYLSGNAPNFQDNNIGQYLYKKYKDIQIEKIDEISQGIYVYKIKRSIS